MVLNMMKSTLALSTRCQVATRGAGSRKEMKPPALPKVMSMTCIGAAKMMVFTSQEMRATGAAALAAISITAGCLDAAAADLVAGKIVFNNNCAACHMGGNNSVITERTLKKAAIEKYLEGGFTLEAIVYQVENGKGAMPAWADRLDEDEIANVANYVYTVASKDGWAAE